MEPKVHQPSIDPDVLADDLRAILPPEAILHEAEQLAPWECDGLSAYRRRPLLVCIPKTVQQLQALLRLCYERQIPVVPRGAGTGLSGGALPDEEGILISLARFNRILEIDTANRLARVQPGVRNIAVSEACAVHGLYYAPDPSSQIACTIGGNIAENAGGVHCLKYGLTVHNVVAMKVLTIDGTMLELGAGAVDAPGYDLLALMTGSEGLLGVVVEATLRLLPLPASTRVLLAAFDSVGAAANTVADIIGAGIVPSGLELMDALAIRAAEDYAAAGYPRDAAAILLCELDGDADELDARMQQVQALSVARGANRIDIASDAAERRRLWAGRKAAFPAMGRVAPDYYCMDGTIPRRRLPEVLERISEWSQEYGLAVANVFHAGDGNLHPLILYDANRPGELGRAEELGDRILELCVQVGGTITGEHGVGVEKIDQMCVQFTDAELRQFHLIKDAFDPYRLLNRGKAVPSLHRCAELGRMHVHGGALAHPELERF